MFPFLLAESLEAEGMNSCAEDKKSDNQSLSAVLHAVVVKAEGRSNSVGLNNSDKRKTRKTTGDDSPDRSSVGGNHTQGQYQPDNERIITVERPNRNNGSVYNTSSDNNEEVGQDDTAAPSRAGSEDSAKDIINCSIDIGGCHFEKEDDNADAARSIIGDESEKNGGKTPHNSGKPEKSDNTSIVDRVPHTSTGRSGISVGKIRDTAAAHQSGRGEGRENGGELVGSKKRPDVPNPTVAIKRLSSADIKLARGGAPVGSDAPHFCRGAVSVLGAGQAAQVSLSCLSKFLGGCKATLRKPPLPQCRYPAHCSTVLFRRSFVE